jgi:hypothetical protein
MVTEAFETLCRSARMAGKWRLFTVVPDDFPPTFG